MKLRSILQIVISAGLLVALLLLARRYHVWGQIRAVPPGYVAAAAALVLAAWAVNSVRWGMLLRVAGVDERPATLLCLYFIGMFCSLLLPTGTGGDAVRMYDVIRRRGQAARVIVATLQERLIGMAVAMSVGLVAVAIYFDRLPPSSRPFLVALPAMAVMASAILIYPRLPLAWAARGWAIILESGAIGRLAARVGNSPLAAKAREALKPAADVAPLTPARLAPVLLVTLASTLMSVGVYFALGRGVGLQVPFGGYCLVVPLVWVISMTPSVGGAGVREGSFVVLMKLFGVPSGQSLAVSALFFLVQTGLACIGGLLLVRRAPTWRASPPASNPM